VHRNSFPRLLSCLEICWHLLLTREGVRSLTDCRSEEGLFFLSRTNEKLVHDVLMCLTIGGLPASPGSPDTMWDSSQRSELKPEQAWEAVGNSLPIRILVVDDDPHFLRVLSRVLTGEDFQVTASPGACEAIEILRGERFDLIICDLRMPDCDGLNFLQGVRQEGNDVPVIILTAYGEVETYLEAMNAGATEYLNKPINSEELLKVVRACLKSYQSRKNNRRANAA